MIQIYNVEHIYKHYSFLLFALKYPRIDLHIEHFLLTVTQVMMATETLL